MVSPVAPAFPHDLALLARTVAVMGDGVVPSWVNESLSRAPLVVLRRARGKDGVLPVGVRGPARHERLAGWLAPAALTAWKRPEELARDAAWRSTPRAAEVPHFAFLERIAAVMSALPLAWGPVGSVGFELASGVPAVTGASDIDLVLRPREQVSRKTARSLLVDLASFPLRVDVQLETPHGAVSLAEYASGTTQIALRTVDGPRLVADPWA